MKEKIYLPIVVLIALFFRLSLLGSVPVGFSNDEASFGYNAYSILKTGRDEYGDFYPLAFKAFGEFKAPLYIYASVPFIAISGLSEQAVRLPSAIFGLLTVIIIYYLVFELTNRKKIALLSSLVLAILPWHLQFTRIAYEGSLTVFLLTLATLFFIKKTSKKTTIYISFILFGLAFYSHYAVRAFLPLFIISLFVLYRNRLLLLKKHFLIGLLILLFTLIPLYPSLFSKEGLFRASYISFVSDKGFVNNINEKRAEHLWSNYKIILPSELLHNKLIDYPKKFFENYLGHFDYGFLFIKGDEDNLFQTPFTGLILLSLIPMLIIGLLGLCQSKDKLRPVILSWLLLAPIPSSLTRLSASANRAFIMVIPVTIIIAYGLFIFSNFVSRKSRFIFLLLLLMISFDFILYLDAYYVHLVIKNQNDNRLAAKGVIKYVKDVSSKYEEVWITNIPNSYIHYLFFLRYSPFIFQQSAKRSQINEYGFSDLLSFDKYQFTRIPKYFDFSNDILFIAKSGEEPKELSPLKKFYRLDGQPSFVIFDTQTVKDQCPSCNLQLKPLNVDVFGEEIQNQ